MTWLPRTAPGATPFARAFGLLPELHARYRAFYDLFWTTRPVDPALLELCRLHMAEILGCTTSPRPELGDDPEQTPLRRACLALAEKFVLDPHGVTTAETDAVKVHLGDAGLVALVEALALFDGFLRFGAILDAEDA